MTVRRPVIVLAADSPAMGASGWQNCRGIRSLGSGSDPLADLCQTHAIQFAQDSKSQSPVTRVAVAWPTRRPLSACDELYTWSSSERSFEQLFFQNALLGHAIVLKRKLPAGRVRISNYAGQLEFNTPQLIVFQLLWLRKQCARVCRSTGLPKSLGLRLRIRNEVFTEKSLLSDQIDCRRAKLRWQKNCQGSDNALAGRVSPPGVRRGAKEVA